MARGQCWGGCLQWRQEVVSVQQGTYGPITTTRCLDCGKLASYETWNDNKTTEPTRTNER